MDLVDEFLAAKEEHARALRQVEEAQKALHHARHEYALAKAVQQSSQRQVDDATRLVTAQMQRVELAHHQPNNCQQIKCQCAVERFVVEFHGNIGCYNAYLMLNTTELAAQQFQIQVAFPEVALTCSATADNQSIPSSKDAKGRVIEEAEAEAEEEEEDARRRVVVWQTLVDHRIDAANVSFTLKEDHLHVRLPLEEDAKRALASSLGSASTSSSLSRFAREELDPQRFEWMKCRKCDHFLRQQVNQEDVETGACITQVLPLPSSNWMEMFDFWGAGAGGFEHLPREDFFARQGRVLIGENHLLVHAKDLMETRLADQPAHSESTDGDHGQEIEQQDQKKTKKRGSDGDGDEDTDWTTVCCRNCGEALGGRHKEQPDTIKFWKHTLACGTMAEDANLLERYSVDSMVSVPMLEQVEADGVFCFELGEFGTCRGHRHAHHHHGSAKADNQESHAASSASVFIQLLNWETMIKHTPNSSNRCKGDSGFVRVLKVLYTTKPPSAMPMAKQFHPLACNPAIRHQILDRLEHSNQLLPGSMRRFGAMSVGYLFA